MKIYIDTVTGNWGVLDNIKFVEYHDLTEEEQVSLTNGDAMSIGKKYGTPVNMTDVSFSNSVSYSPEAIREEIACIEGLHGHTEEIEWFNNHATKDHMELMASYILEDDNVWIDYRSNLLEALRWIYDQQDSSTDDTTN